MSDTIYLRDIRKRPGFLTVWEKHRDGSLHWCVELFAEAVRPFLGHAILLLDHLAVAWCLSLLVTHKLQSVVISLTCIDLLPKFCRSA